MCEVGVCGRAFVLSCRTRATDVLQSEGRRHTEVIKGADKAAVAVIISRMPLIGLFLCYNIRPKEYKKPVKVHSKENINHGKPSTVFFLYFE